MSHNKHVINTTTGQCKVCMLNTTTGFTRECLGKPMHPLTMKAVRLGEVDYYDGAFHSKTEAKEETIANAIKSVAGRHGIRVEIHEPRMHRAGSVNEPSARDDYVPNRDDLAAYEAMEKFINDFMAAKQEPEEYALSKDEIEFLKQIYDQPIPKRVIADLDLTRDQFIMLHGLKKAGYVYASVDGDKTWIVTPKAKAYLESFSEPAPLAMTEQGIALLLLLSESSIDNDEIMSEETISDAADLLIGLDLAYDCGEHLHITIKGRIHVAKLIEMKIN
jgi:hypothetical protein